MPGDARLKTAIEAVKDVCRAIAELAEKVENSNTDERERAGIARRLSDALDSLYSRTREAPQILATWGAPGLIVFYAAKAADQVKEDAQTLRAIIDSVLCEKGEINIDPSRIKIDDTALGYALHLITMARYLKEKGILDINNLCNAHVGQSGSVAKEFLIEFLDKAAKGEYRFSELAYIVETLARLYAINLAPLQGRLEELRHTRADAKEVLETITDFCKINTR